jgi:hypothetical protein
MSPTLTALMVATFDRYSGGRLLLNVVTGGDLVIEPGLSANEAANLLSKARLHIDFMKLADRAGIPCTPRRVGPLPVPHLLRQVTGVEAQAHLRAASTQLPRQADKPWQGRLRFLR